MKKHSTLLVIREMQIKITISDPSEQLKFMSVSKAGETKENPQFSENSWAGVSIGNTGNSSARSYDPAIPPRDRLWRNPFHMCTKWHAQERPETCCSSSQQTGKRASREHRYMNCGAHIQLHGHGNRPYLST